MKKMPSALHVGTHRMRAGEVWQTIPASAELTELFARLRLQLPARHLSLPAPKAGTA